MGMMELVRELGSFGLLAWLVVMGANFLPRMLAALERIEEKLEGKNPNA